MAHQISSKLGMNLYSQALTRNSRSKTYQVCDEMKLLYQFYFRGYLFIFLTLYILHCKLYTTLYMKRMKAMITFWEEAVTEYKHLLLILFDEIKVAAPRLSSCNFHQYFYPTCLITRHPTAFWSSTRWFSNLKAGTNCSSFPRSAFCFVSYLRLS